VIDMEPLSFFDSVWFEWVIIPILICIARITDVSIGTLRIIFVSKGMKYIAPLMGFFEVIIWLLAIGQIMQNLSNFVNYIAYGLGFAIGNFIGIYIEEKISLGYRLMRIITRRSAENLKEWLRRSNYRFTIVDGTSDWGEVNIIYMPLRRRDVREVANKVKEFNPHAFYTLEDITTISDVTFRNGKDTASKFSRLFPRAKKK
jgi:uncharacterized protein YebE (UPF0316 family)